MSNNLYQLLLGPDFPAWPEIRSGGGSRNNREDWRRRLLSAPPCSLGEICSQGPRRQVQHTRPNQENFSPRPLPAVMTRTSGCTTSLQAPSLEMHTYLPSFQPNRMWLVIVSGHFPNPWGIEKTNKKSTVCLGQGQECKGMLALRRHMQTLRRTSVMSISLGLHLPSHSLGKILLVQGCGSLACENTGPARGDCTNQGCNACSVLSTGLPQSEGSGF